MKAILLISEVKEHAGAYSVAWKRGGPGGPSGFYTADTVDFLSSQLAGLFVKLLADLDQGPEPDPEIEMIEAEPESGDEAVAVAMADSESLENSFEAALAEWGADATAITPDPSSLRGS